MMYWGHGHGGGWGLALVVTILLLAVAALALLALGTLRSGRDHTGSPARLILGERLARGEIEVEEYKNRLAALRDAG